jgi:glycerophosphoryl diester phosphodiesterase
MRRRESIPRHSAQEWIRATGVFVFLLAISAPTAEAHSIALVEAHRGDSIHAPENTVASIQSAAGTADLTEMDVRVTADGALVLMHDSTVDRTTNGTGSVASLTLAQLQSLDAGSWFSPAFAGEPVPTMAAAIAASKAAYIQPLIERKTGTANAYHTEFMAQSLAPDEFRVIAFDWGFLDDLDALNPAYNLGALDSGPINQSVIDTVAAHGGDFLDWGHASINQAAVDLVHANGMELHAWTVNDATRMQQLIDYGIDGITTDNPALLRDLLPSLAPTPVLVVDRDTGDIRLENVEANSVGIKGYRLQSTIGALNPSGWLSIADNYDAGSPGPDQIDPNNNWTVQADIDTNLSEAELEGGNGATIAGDSSVLLGLDVWLKNPFENDLRMEMTFPRGNTDPLAIEYEGNGGKSFALGDFDFDGDLDAADWLIHNAGRGANLTGLSIAQGYHLGDINGSGQIDMTDFILFKQHFEGTNGAGSFAAMVMVPEPSTLLLLLVTPLFGLSMRIFPNNLFHNRHKEIS